MGFMDLEKACDRVNREVLGHAPRMQDVGAKMLDRINSCGFSWL